MDMRKIGGFLKMLRKEKGLTQEQLAEVLLVSGRTVSRWETGTNLPDLSILIQMAEFYDVEVKEILDGERKGDTMDNELRETLSKVADYNRAEREKLMKVGNAGFVITFAACAAAIVAQLVLGADLPAVLGETVTLFVGGLAYIAIALRHGLFRPGAARRETAIGVLCSSGMTVAMVIRSVRMGMPPERIGGAAALFFAGITLLGFAVIKALYFIQDKLKKDRV